MRRNQIWPEMIHPPAGDRRSRKHDRDDEDAFAICDRKNTGNEHQRKQTGYNEIATFDFLDKRRPDEKETQRNEKLHCGEATESWSPRRRVHWLFRRPSFVHVILHNVVIYRLPCSRCPIIPNEHWFDVFSRLIVTLPIRFSRRVQEASPSGRVV